MRIYVCSSNQGKLSDFSAAAQAYGDGGVALQPLPGIEHIQPPEEHGSTFEENARAKALYYSSFTSGPVLADDSGLEVDALQGAPGVYSARYAGLGATDPDNNDLLLRNLAGVREREARFICVLALAGEGHILLTAKGSVEGTIVSAAAGSGGFGYDPLFFYQPLQRTFGQLSTEEKLTVSHRGCALRHLFQLLREIHPA